MSVKDNNTLKRVDPLYKRYSYGRIRPSLLIHPFEQRRKYGQRKEILGPAINKNPQFNDFSLDYKSTGEPDPFYESDFKDGTDGWYGVRGTVQGNIDGIGGEDDVLKYYANSDNSVHRACPNIAFVDGQYYRVTGKIYIPSTNTNLDGIKIFDGYSPDGYLEITTTDTWVDFDVEIHATSPGDERVYLAGMSGGSTFFTGANSSSNDLFYVKDVKVQRVGLMAYWHFNDVFSRLNGGGGYIGEDWHLGGPVYGDELIIDGGFEEWSSATNLTNWIGAYTSTGVRDILQENSVVYSGDYSVKIKTTNNDGTTDVYIWQNNVPVTPNKLYKISVRTYAKQLTSGYIYLIADGSSGWNFYRTITNTAEPDWTEHTFYYYPKDSTNTIKIGLFNETNGEIYLDNFSIREISNGYHLLLSPGFDYQNQMDGEDPLYKNGRTARLDGVNDYYYIPGSNADWANPKNNSASYVFWFHTGDSTINKNLFLKYGISNPSYINIYIDEDGKIRFNMKDADGNGTYLTSLLLEKNTDYCIACVYDKNTAIKKVFVNGVLLNSQSVTFTAGIEPDYDLTIGKDGFVKSSFDSYIYAVAIFNRALSETEIKEINGKAKGYEYHDGSGANAYDGVLKNEGFIQRVENTDHQYQWIGQGSDVVGYLDPSKLYKVMFRLKIDNGKRAFVRLGSAGGTKDWVYTGDGNWHDYYFYTRGEIEGDRIYSYGLYTWDTNTVAEWDNFAIREVRNLEYVGDYALDLSKEQISRGPEVIINGNFDNDTDSDGLADNWQKVGNDLDHTSASIVTGNGFNKAQRIESIDGFTGTYIRLIQDYNRLPLYHWYELTFKYRASYSIYCGPTQSGYEWYTLPKNTDDARPIKLLFWADDEHTEDWANTMFQINTTSPGTWFEIGDVSLREIKPNAFHGIFKGGIDSNIVTDPFVIPFDGVNDWIDFKNVLNIGVNDLILWAWVRGHSKTGRIISKQDSSTQQLYYLRREENGKFRAGLGDGSTVYSVSTDHYYNDDQRYFVCAVFDRDGNLEIFVNDKLDGTVDISPAKTTHISNDKSLTFGILAPEMAELFGDDLGPSGIVLFNGQNGVPDHLPYYYRDFIRHLYELDKDMLKNE